MQSQLEFIQIEQHRIDPVPEYESAQDSVELHLYELNYGGGSKHVHALNELVHHQQRTCKQDLFQQLIFHYEKDCIIFALDKTTE